MGSGEVEYRKRQQLVAEIIHTMLALDCPARAVLKDSWYIDVDSTKALALEGARHLARAAARASVHVDLDLGQAHHRPVYATGPHITTLVWILRMVRWRF